MKVVFTNGCFDILHPGHIEYLKESAKYGRLIVGLNSDDSVKRLKGPSRPINNQDVRRYMLEQFPFIWRVEIFEEDTPYELIKKIRPNIITKGGDYTVDTVVGNDIAEVIIIKTLPGFSTSDIVRKCNANRE